MPRRTTPLEVPLGERPSFVGLSWWLHQELRQAILDGRLQAGVRLPSSRDFAEQHNVSRGTVVAVFEQLEAEGFLAGRKGFGTWVRELPHGSRRCRQLQPAAINMPSPLTGLKLPPQAVAFRSYEPALDQFPMATWAKIAGKRLRRASTSQLAHRDPRGSLALREALADFLGISRGLRCDPEQIVVVTGTQQALDLLARVLFKPGDSVWMEDPGYFGAIGALHNAGVKTVPVKVDAEGLSVEAGKALAPRAKGVYLTPGHQFPLGTAMTLARRLEVLAWAQSTGAFVLEDDYDGAYRLSGPLTPALHSMDRNESVILISSFNKVLFSSLRIGYMVLPQRLVDPVLAYRFTLDQNSVGLDQTVLAEFIEQGHLGRHIRHTRDLYAERLEILKMQSDRHLKGLLDVADVQTGLYTTGLLKNGMRSREAEQRALAQGVETMALDRFRIKHKTPEGLVLGFAPFDERAIEAGVRKLASALSSK